MIAVIANLEHTADLAPDDLRVKYFALGAQAGIRTFETQVDFVTGDTIAAFTARLKAAVIAAALVNGFSITTVIGTNYIVF
jgi:hypothetical protein